MPAIKKSVKVPKSKMAKAEPKKVLTKEEKIRKLKPGKSDRWYKRASREDGWD